MAKKQNTDNGLRDLKQALKDKNPGRLYFFYGEETFLLSYHLDRLKKLILDPVTESFNFHRFTEETWSMTDFADALEMLPMMAEKTMVQVDDVELFKLPEDERNRLAEVFRDIPSYCTVVFTYLTAPWKPDKRMRKLWEAMESSGLVVEFARQDQRDLVPWVGRHFAAHDKRISTELCMYLIEITGGTMTALNGEIEKICAFSGAPEICRADIDAVTEPVLDAVVFQMTDMLCAGDYRGALEKLNQLLKMQQEPIPILGAVGSSFRRLSAARVFLDRGKSPYELQDFLGIWDKAARQAMTAARNLSPNFLRRASELIIETDYRMKTSFDDQQRLLEMMILTLAQEAKHG